MKKYIQDSVADPQRAKGTMAVQTFVNNSIILIDLEFNCTMGNFLCPCNRLLIDFNFSTFHTSLKCSPDARIWYSIGGSKGRYIPLSIISLHIRRCKGKLGFQNFWPNWQEYQFSIWLAKNTPPLPPNESWLELGTLSFDCSRIPSPPLKIEI